MRQAHDDLEAFALLNPALTVIAHGVAGIGHFAVDLLTDVIGGGTPASTLSPGAFSPGAPPPELKENLKNEQ